MDVTATLDAPCPVTVLLTEVADLSGYPAWLGIVPAASVAEPAEGDGGPAWSVELRGRLGPLARSKRLRMVRTVAEGLGAPDAAAGRVRFERRELDGRDHSPWILDAAVGARPDGSRLVMSLHYGGRLGGGPVERMLSEEIDRSRPALLARVAGDRPGV